MIEKLQKILTDKDFIALQQWNKNKQIFDILKTNEMTHSSMIAWLINPNEGHDLGTLFIKNMFYSLAVNDNLTINEIESISFQNLLIETEVSVDKDNRIDILIYDPVNRYLFIIENKCGASLFKDQLKRYKEWADKLKNLNKITLILLDKDKTAEPEKDWLYSDYSWITNTLSSILNKGILSTDNEKILKDYYIKLTENYDIDGVFSKYEKHMVRLAKHHADFFSELKDIREDLLDLTITDKLNNINETKKTQTDLVLTLEQHFTIFNTLLEYSEFEWLEKALKKTNKNYLFHLKDDTLLATLKQWEELCEDNNSYWPVTLRVEKDCDETGTYKFIIYLDKNDIKNEYKDKLVHLAKQYGKEKYNTNSKNITISNGVNPENLLNTYKNELNKLNENTLIVLT